MGDESLECLGSVVEEGVEMGDEEMLNGQEDDDSLASTQNPDYREERFRVDRRKLEQLLQATEDERKNADEFFNEIMQETNTTIMWPAKLKIGAKSKKDPLIKVCGLKDAVLQAKEKIMCTLNTKSLRVTLKMEVSHTEHSHVIGKGGNNIQRVMQETDCHIHFPDSNRNNLGEKSNQVSVTGQCPSVESARVKIRMLLPIVILFELPSSASLPMHLDSSSAVFHQIQQRYGVSVVAKQHLQPGHGYVQTVIVRGSVCNAKSVEEAVVVLFETLTGQAGTSFSVTLLMDIAPSHHSVIIGYDGSNIKQVIRRTGATIYFPNTTAVNSPRSTLYITGAIPNVFHARQELMGWLPVVLMFDVKEDNELEPGQITQLMEQLDVFISLKPKAKQPLKSVIVKSTERNISRVYEARKILLSLMTETQSSSSASNALVSAETSKKLSAVSRPGVSNSVSSSPVYQLPFSSAQANRSPIRSPTILPTYITASRGFQPVIILPPVQSYHLPVAYGSTPCLPAGGNFPVTVKVPSSGGLLPVPNKTSPLIVSSGDQQALKEDSRDTDSTSKLATSVSWSSGLSMADRSENMIPSNLLLSPNRSASHELRDSSLKQPQNVSTFDDTTGFFSSHSEKRHLGKANNFDVSKMMSMDTDSLLKFCLQNSTTYSNAFNQSRDLGSNASNQSQDLGSNASNQSRDLAASPHISASKPSLPLYQSTDISNNLSLLTSGQSLKSATASAFCETDQESPVVCQTEPSSPPVLRRFGQLPSPCNQVPHYSDDSRDLLLHSSQNVPYELCATNVPDPSKAPGRGRPKKSICSSFLTSHDLFADFDYDYEEKKLSATRAMQQKPVGDSRVPTDCWSGLYFSKSMPDQALYDKLSQNVFRFRSPAMSSTSENAETEMEDSSWRSPLPSYDYSSGNPSLDRFQCSVMPDSHSYGSASDMNNISTELTSSNDFSGEKSSQVKVEAQAYSSPLSTLSEIWQPKVKESDPPQPCDLAELFSKLGLGKYTDLFQQQEIDLSTFVTLTENDLKELGISTFGARRKMLLAIADHNERQRFIPPPPGLPNPFRDSNLPRRHDTGSQSGRW